MCGALILYCYFHEINVSEMGKSSDSNTFQELCYCKIRKGFTSEEVSFRNSVHYVDSYVIFLFLESFIRAK